MLQLKPKKRDRSAQQRVHEIGSVRREKRGTKRRLYGKRWPLSDDTIRRLTTGQCRRHRCTPVCVPYVFSLVIASSIYWLHADGNGIKTSPWPAASSLPMGTTRNRAALDDHKCDHREHCTRGAFVRCQIGAHGSLGALRVLLCCR